MTITSKYAGRCKKCGGPIAVGDQIDWVRGAGSTHLECEAPATGIAVVGGFKTPAVTEPGVYERADGQIYVVKPNQEKTRMYAKRLVEINADRLTEADTTVQIEFVYEQGAIYTLVPEDKMPLEKAKALTIRYRRCIVCGIKLEAKESVERGIGPVCIKYFAGYRTAKQIAQDAADEQLMDGQATEAERAEHVRAYTAEMYAERMREKDEMWLQQELDDEGLGNSMGPRRF